MTCPPPCRWPSTCQCPLEAWGSPVPSVPRPQRSDRAGQPVKSHLSAVQTALETSYTHCSLSLAPNVINSLKKKRVWGQGGVGDNCEEFLLG